MNQEFKPVKNYHLNPTPVSENTEGGLNITELKNIFLRQLPLIAGCTLGLTLLGVFKILTAPPVYSSQFELLSEPINIETQVTSTSEDSRKTREEITDVNLDEVQLKILKSHRLILRIVEALKDKYPELSYGNLTADLSIEIISGSQEDQNILQVIYRNPDKQKVIDVLNTLTKVYQDYSVEKRQSGIKRGVEFLDRQIPKIFTEAEEIEQQIAELRTEYNFNDPNISLDQITVRINQLAQKREENALKLQELNLTLSKLDQELATEPANLTSAIDFATPRYLELLTRLREIDVEISQKSAIFSDKSEILQASQKEKQELNILIAEAGKDIRRKVVDKIIVLENRKQSLERETNNFRIQLRQWSEISGEYKNLQNKLSIANSKLNKFNSQKDSLQIDSAQQESPWQLLTPAGEPTTNNLNTINYVMLSSTLGFCLGIGLAFILDKQQNIIYSSVKVEEITNLPILAAIPYSPKPKKLLPFKSKSLQQETEELPLHGDFLQVRKKPSLEFSTPSIEAFRSFAANIGLFNFNNNSENLIFNNNLKSIAITSAIPREGKSTVALNLARATASIGKRVLIVDADLRSSEHITNSFGLENEVGLKNILEQNISQSGSQYVRKLPLEENLFILTSGYDDALNQLSNKDPSLLLASVKMHSLMEELKAQFDLVIYDLCSIIGFADVNLLANQTDGIVVVTGLGKIQTMAFTEALNQLNLCQAPVMGVVLNKLVNKN